MPWMIPYIMVVMWLEIGAAYVAPRKPKAEILPFPKGKVSMK